jgi:Protein of unknown function (DUF3999)
MMFQRVRQSLSIVFLFVAVLGVLSFTAEARTNDLSDWKNYRTIQIPADRANGFAAVALDSEILEKCKPDMGDLRIVDSNGSPVPFNFEAGKSNGEPAAIPANVFRIVKVPGKWTDVWIDKTSKFLSSGIRVQTSSKNFIRKVEIRGSDDERQSYVIKMDGLLADVVKPFAFSSLDLNYPLNNNFQYLHLRIFDGNLAPLKIDGVLCRPPEAKSILVKPCHVRIVENRPGSSDSWIIIGDLGDRRFPLTCVGFSTPEKKFVRKAVVYAANSDSGETWKKIAAGIVFRLHKDGATKERLEIPVSAEQSRYVKLVVYGGRHATPLSNMEAWAGMPVAVFEYHRGTEYRLFYGNPNAPANAIKLPAMNINRVLSAAPLLHPGEEHKNIVRYQPVPASRPHKIKAPDHHWAKIFGAGMIIVGILLLFGLILKIYASRRAQRSKFYITKIHY